MRLALLSIFVLGTSFSFAKKAPDFKEVHSKVNAEFYDKLQENPQMYETKPIVRKPASVQPVRKNIEKIDEIEMQADTHTNW